MMTVSLGKEQPPLFFIIGSLTKVPSSLSEIQKHEEAYFTTSPSGNMDDFTIIAYAQLLAKWVISLRKSGYYEIRKPILLLLDGHQTRNNITAQEIFQNAGITCIAFLGGLTHVLQPNDRVINRQWRKRFKAKLRNMKYIEKQNKMKQLNMQKGWKISFTADEKRMMMILCSIDAYQEVTTLQNRKSSFECTGLCHWSPERACASEYIKDDKDKPIYPNGRIMKGHDASFALLVPGWIKNDEIGVKVKRKRDFTIQDDNQEDFQEKINSFDQKKKFKQEKKRKRFRISESQSPKSSLLIRNTPNSGSNVKSTQCPGVTVKRIPSLISFVTHLPNTGSDVRKTSKSGSTVKCTLISDKAAKNELLSNADEAFSTKDPDSSKAKMATNEKKKKYIEKAKNATTLTLQEMRDELENLNRCICNNDGDGNCYYMTFTHQIYGTNALHAELRQNAVREQLQNKVRYSEDFADEDETLENYASRMANLGEYADARMNLPICVAYGINLGFFLGNNKFEIIAIHASTWVEIAYVDQIHYVSII
ncbi:MAG: hypothetical protein EZS28_000568 [Streblomastix strix]|uniref:DDE-1 domain-containing protein n=1 Tax=Streblomastix strix TaxID=222440 RepID=A0A5J4X9F0_9EUKA|nr:MAG: hypothetical protein EZS28_000568 [Streblomastix strix]